jgi:catechol 2,3-dioxygenase-like lactoylglutathione lyase family enzyme
MINRIQVTTVFVNDQDKAKVFYTDKLGMKLKVDMPMGPDFRWLEVIPANGEASIALSRPFPGMTVGGPTGIIFDTGDMQSAYQQMKANGVTFTEEPHSQPWGGIQAQFSDPDGNLFNLVERAQ